MQDQHKWITVNNTLHVLIRSYVELSDLVAQDDVRQELDKLAIEAHRQLWVVKKIYEDQYGKELCPCMSAN